MSQLLKPTVCLAFVLGGVLDVMAVRIAVARHVTVSLIAGFLLWGKHFRVDITRQSVFVKCAILTLMCCIHCHKNLCFAMVARAVPRTEHSVSLWIGKTGNIR